LRLPEAQEVREMIARAAPRQTGSGQNGPDQTSA